MVFFFKFTYVFDEANGGVKPFCTLANAIIDDQILEEEDEESMTWSRLVTSFQTYNFLLSIVQVGFFFHGELENS